MRPARHRADHPADPERVAGIVSLAARSSARRTRGIRSGCPSKNAVGMSKSAMSPAGPLQLQAPRSGCSGRRRRRRLDTPRKPLCQRWGCRGGGAQDDRQRPRQYGHHLRVRYGGPTSTEAIDKLHSTASAHERVMVCRADGAVRGWIALNSGISRVGGRDPDP